MYVLIHVYMCVFVCMPEMVSCEPMPSRRRHLEAGLGLAK